MPLTINVLRTQWKAFTSAHPLLRGSLSYAILWPTSSLIQQTLEGKNLKTYDYMRALRFGIFGSLYVAPSLYGWVKLTSAMWPQMTLRVGLIKAAIEQLSYGPFACASFFAGMSLLEGKSKEEAVQEVQDKFLPTFKVGICIWPVLQTINFSMVPERHRVVFVSICSLMWTTFLAYMKRKEMHENEEQQEDDLTTQHLGDVQRGKALTL
ncbi:mpv17-like protein [Musca domestica]|uniref:Mpv17-like protein n=1 Tax=Musca domestica TaxID=7370 RepID=A0A1I8MN04_MUSDO|nr:mpv17-like protein [Musca domestica]